MLAGKWGIKIHMNSHCLIHPAQRCSSVCDLPCTQADSTAHTESIAGPRSYARLSVLLVGELAGWEPFARKDWSNPPSRLAGECSMEILSIPHRRIFLFPGN